MKSKSMLVYVFLCAYGMVTALVAQPAQADEGKTYLRFDVGPNWVSDIAITEVDGEYIDSGWGKFKLDTGLRFDLAYGVNLSRVFALELEASVLYNSFNSFYGEDDDGDPFDNEISKDLWQIPVMLNGVFTLMPNSKIHPYAGVGLGGVCAFVPSDIDSDSYCVAYQFLLGVKYEVSEKMDVGLGYKLLGSFRHSRLLDPFTTDYLTNHSIVAALTIHF